MDKFLQESESAWTKSKYYQNVGTNAQVQIIWVPREKFE